MISGLGIVAVVLVLMFGGIILWGINWRWTLLSLGVLYGVEFALVLYSWDVGLAAVKLIVGWMALAIIGTSPAITSALPSGEPSSKKIFRVVWFGIAALIAIPSAQKTLLWIPAQELLMISGLILIGAGLVQVGLTSKPIPIITGLLLLLAGFEIIYASVVTSILVAGLLAGITLGIALVGSYLMVTPQMGGDS